VSMAYDTLKGMVYLASQKILHRDLAARNLLVKFRFVNFFCLKGV
jgi:hypothetical protein